MWGLCGTYAKDLLEESLPEDISAANGRIFVSVVSQGDGGRGQGKGVGGQGDGVGVRARG